MYSSNWYQAKTQYIDNFVLTARSNEPEPVVVDKTALQKAIDANTGKVETDYTAETWLILPRLWPTPRPCWPMRTPRRTTSMPLPRR